MTRQKPRGIAPFHRYVSVQCAAIRFECFPIMSPTEMRKRLPFCPMWGLSGMHTIRSANDDRFGLHLI